MVTRLLLLAGMLLALLVPRPVAAAPAPRPFECRLAASIARVAPETNIRFIRETQVIVADQTLTLRICASDAESADADRILRLFAAALPHLSRYAGVAYQGSLNREIVLTSAQELDRHYADGLVDAEGVIYLHADSYDWTVVHEAAHLWANYRHFDTAELWLIEGYAEYLTELAMVDLGNPERSPLPEVGCEGTPLLSWSYTPPRVAHCGYRVGAAVFRDLVTAVGLERFNAALAAISAGRTKITSLKLLMALEQDLSVDVVDVMRGRVFPSDSHWDAYLEWRQAQRLLLAEAARLAVALDVELSPQIAWEIDQGATESVEARLAALLPLLEVADEATRRCRDQGLDCATPWQPLPADPAAQAEMTIRLHQSVNLLDHYARLAAAAGNLKLAPSPAITAAVVALDPAATTSVQRAEAVLRRGQRLEQRCAEQEAPCGAAWRNQWQGADFDAADATLAVLTALLDQAAAGEPPYAARGLAADYRRVWRAALAHDPATVPATLADLAALLDRAALVERQCAEAGWPCAGAWHASFGSGGVAATRALLDRTAAALPELQQIDAALEPARTTEPVLLEQLLWPGRDPLALLEQARQSFAAGAVATATTQARAAHAAYARGETEFALLQGLALWLLALLVLALAGWAGADFYRYRRRRRAQRAADQSLLARLMAQPPDKL